MNRILTGHLGLRWTLYLPPLAMALLLGAGCGGSAADDSSDDYAARMAQEHDGDTPVAGDAGRAADTTRKITTTQPVYATVDGTEVTGYFAEPLGAADDTPGLLVIHEWWGLNDNIETMARMFAQQGYRALAVDLYGGQMAEDPEGARALMQAAMESPERAQENLRQAHAFLTGRGAGRTGSIGWCFGGAWSLESALLLPGELDAAVIYYGRLVTDKKRLAPLTAPILGIFGSEDRGIPVAQVEAFEAALDELGKVAEIHLYEGANHAFANPSGSRYAPQAAKDAWEKTLAFFDAHLSDDESDSDQNEADES
ncbi:MAG: dienelactone hydrolase family protein [Acidobacteriota bacterium]